MYSDAEIDQMNTNESENEKQDHFTEMMQAMDTTGKAIHKRGRSTYYGIVVVDGDLACEQCKTRKPACTTVMHADSTKSYTWVYKCDTCGNYITMETQRSKKDRQYWEG
ncbi:hypothetical protein M7775_02465 [Sporomusa sphaeroides DSM 2875]|uniref:hypothetical protein n=1 Tax=Sporomusa sphaeroides TaxID=47679 RepID=UPI0020306F56|nr:hypothetical protein [Sporomusa sphaeroides]MCM0757430.1 hypothetical protein [Sporomusa sphaeroides DSM 2875]